MDEPEAGVVEFRQYTLRPGQREVLIDLFDREFVESQEVQGMQVMGQFRDLDRPDLFVWMRAFRDMAARQRALEGFYGGPVWAAHRDAANATMIDSDNVLLLRPAWPGAGQATGPRPVAGTPAAAAGVVDATVFYLREPAGPALLELARGLLSSILGDGGARQVAWYVTEPAANNFPRLPVREGEHVLLGLALFDSAEAFAGFAASGTWQARGQPALAPYLARPPEAHRLEPTSRSALRA